MAGGVTVGFGRSRALVGEQTVSWSGEACALHSYHASEPFAASRVCDERSGTNRRTALDPAPASQALPVSLDFADAFIDVLSLEGPPLSQRNDSHHRNQRSAPVGTQHCCAPISTRFQAYAAPSYQASGGFYSSLPLPRLSSRTCPPLGGPARAFCERCEGPAFRRYVAAGLSPASEPQASVPRFSLQGVGPLGPTLSSPSPWLQPLKKWFALAACPYRQKTYDP